LARFQLAPGPIPFHHQVYLHLRAAIDDGQWAVGDRLPPERELAKQYGCSLITVRRALADLAREDRLERTRGRGTFVKTPRIVRELTSTISFSEEMELRGFEPRTRLLTSRIEPAAEADAAALGIQPGAPVVFLERLRSAGDTPLLLEQVRLSAAQFGDLLEADLERGSLYDFLAVRHDRPIERLSETIEPVLLPAREARLLGQSGRQPALLLQGVAYDGADRPVEVSRTYVPGHHSKFLVVSSGRAARGIAAMRASNGGQRTGGSVASAVAAGSDPHPSDAERLVRASGGRAGRSPASGDGP
jgi:GntR family transcriptional regulator